MIRCPGRGRHVAALVGAVGMGALLVLACAAPRAHAADVTVRGVSAADATGIPVDDQGIPIKDPATVTLKNQPKVEMNGRLAVFLDGVAAPVDPARAVLYLNGRAITGLTNTLYLANQHTLVFRLARSNANAAAWGPLLGSPGKDPGELNVGVSLDNSPSGDPKPALAGTQPKFNLVLITGASIIAASVAFVLVVALVWAGGRNSNILKDCLLPQLAPKELPYSLGRWQMAFWFTLIFAAFVFLLVLLWDYNTLTDQSLMLMGISGATAVFAVAIDAAKDTPIGRANETLRALGLNTYDDVQRLDREILDRQAALNANPAPAPAAKVVLQTELADRLAKRRTYRDLTRPFVSVGFFRDLMTDVNGPALHRVQVFVWTLAIGVVFVIDVYRTLSLPVFSSTLLALMGVTSAGYLGFKYPEQQH